MPPSDTERDEIRHLRDHHIGRLFLQAHRAYSAHAVEALRARGYSELGAAHAAILPHIDVEGTRTTVIAERSGMTKQGAGQVVDWSNASPIPPTAAPPSSSSPMPAGTTSARPH
jgi:hypothetical protein